jgi:hypothetical protein
MQQATATSATSATNGATAAPLRAAEAATALRFDEAAAPPSAAGDHDDNEAAASCRTGRSRKEATGFSAAGVAQDSAEVCSSAAGEVCSSAAGKVCSSAAGNVCSSAAGIFYVEGQGRQANSEAWDVPSGEKAAEIQAHPFAASRAATASADGGSWADLRRAATAAAASGEAAKKFATFGASTPWSLLEAWHVSSRSNRVARDGGAPALRPMQDGACMHAACSEPGGRGMERGEGGAGGRGRQGPEGRGDGCGWRRGRSGWKGGSGGGSFLPSAIIVSYSQLLEIVAVATLHHRACSIDLELHCDTRIDVHMHMILLAANSTKLRL